MGSGQLDGKEKVHLFGMRLRFGHSIRNRDDETHPGALAFHLSESQRPLREQHGEPQGKWVVCGDPVPLGLGATEPICASFGRGNEALRLDYHQWEMAALSLSSNTRTPLPASCSWVHAWVSAFSTWERKGAISSVRFWAHEQLTHVIHSFDVSGLFVEADDHSSALDKLIVSIKDLNECHMQIQGNKAELQSRLHPPGTPWAPGGVEVLQGSPAIGDNSLFSSAHPSALKTVTLLSNSVAQDLCFKANFTSGFVSLGPLFCRMLSG